MSNFFNEAYIDCPSAERDTWTEALRASLDMEVPPSSPTMDEIMAESGKDAQRKRSLAAALAIGSAVKPDRAAARLLWQADEIEDESEVAAAARDFRTGIVWWLANSLAKGGSEDIKWIGLFLQNVEGIDIERWKETLVGVVYDAQGELAPAPDSALGLLARAMTSLAHGERNRLAEALLVELGLDPIDQAAIVQTLVLGTVAAIAVWFDERRRRDRQARKRLTSTEKKTKPKSSEELPSLQVVPMAWSQELGDVGPVDVWLARLDDDLFVRVSSSSEVAFEQSLVLARRGSNVGTMSLTSVKNPKERFLVPELSTGHWFHAGALSRLSFEAFSGTGWVLRTPKDDLDLADTPKGISSESEGVWIDALKDAENGTWSRFIFSIIGSHEPPNFLLRIHVRYYLMYLLTRVSNNMEEKRMRYLKPHIVERLLRVDWLGEDVRDLLARRRGREV